jgi:integrase
MRDGKWTGRWFGQVKHKGRKFRSSLVPTKGEAVQWEVDKRRELENPPAPPPSATSTATVSLLEWGNKYLDFAVRYVPKTYSEKKMILARLMSRPDLDVLMPAATFTAGQALDHLQEQFKERGGNAANKERKNLAAAWAWGSRFKKLPKDNPFMEVPPFPEHRVDRHVPTEEEFWRVVDVAERQDRAMLLSFLHTAARRGELFRLRWEDVDFEEGRVRLYTRKRKDGSMQEDWIPMTVELAWELAEHQCRLGRCENGLVFFHQEGRHKGEPFKEDRKFMRELCELAEVRFFDRHAIRHLTASILAKRGVPSVVIQGVLRHKRLSTTEKYVKKPSDNLRPYLRLLEGGRGPKAQHGAQQKAATA